MPNKSLLISTESLERLLLLLHASSLLLVTQFSLNTFTLSNSIDRPVCWLQIIIIVQVFKSSHSLLSITQESLICQNLIGKLLHSSPQCTEPASSTTTWKNKAQIQSTQHKSTFPADISASCCTLQLWHTGWQMLPHFSAGFHGLKSSFFNSSGIRKQSKNLIKL